MALTISLLGTATWNTTSGTKTVTATPAVGDLLIIVTAHSGNVNTTAPTDNNAGGGGTYTLINTAFKASSADTMKIWVRDALITSATSTVFTHAPGTTTGGGLAVIDIQGASVAGASAIIQSAIQSNQTFGAAPAPVFAAAPSSSSGIIGAVFAGGNPANLTPRANYTELFDLGYNTPASGLEVMTRNSGETSATITWGSTSSSVFCSMVVEVSGAATHDTTGTLTGQGSTVTGAATNFMAHDTSGALTGPGSTVAGTATRSAPPHTTSGTLTGPGSTIAGAAPHNPVTHSTSGTLTGTSSAISVVKAGVNVSMPVVTLGTYADTNSGAKSVTATPAVGALPIIITYHAANADYTTLPTDDNGGGGTYVLVDRTSHFNYIDGQNGQLNVWVRTTRISAAVSTTFTHNPGTTSGGGLNVMALMGGSLSGLSAITYHYAAAGGANVVNPYILLKTLNRSDVSIELLGHVSTSAPAIALSITGYTWLAGPTMSYSGPDYSHTIAISDTVAGAGEVYSQRWFVNTSGYYSYATLTLRETNKHDATGSLTGPGSAIVGAATKPVVHGTSGALPGQTAALSAGRAGRNISQPIVFLGSTADTNDGAKSVTVTVAAGSLPVVFIGHTATTNDLTAYNTAPTDSLGGTYVRVGGTTKPGTYLLPWTRTARIGSTQSITFTHTPPYTTGGGAIFVMALTEGTLAGSGAAADGNSVWWDSATNNPYQQVVSAKNRTDVVLQYYWSDETQVFSGPTTSGFNYLPLASASFSTPTSQIVFTYSEYVAPSDTTTSIATWGGYTTAPIALGFSTFRTTNTRYATGALTGQGSTIVGAATKPVVHATSGALTGQGSALSAARAGRNLSQPVIFLGSSSTTTDGTGTFTLTVTPPVGSLPIVYVSYTGSGSSFGSLSDNNSGGSSYTPVGFANRPGTGIDCVQGYIRNARITSATSTTFTFTPPEAVTGIAIVALALTEGTLVGSNIGTGPFAAGSGFNAGTTNPVQGAQVARKSDVSILAMLYGGATSPLADPAYSGFSYKLGGSASYNTPDSSLYIHYSDYVDPSAGIVWIYRAGTSDAYGAMSSISLRAQDLHDTSGALTGQGSTVTGSAPHNPVTHSTSGTLAGQGSTLSAGRAGRNISQPIVYLGSTADTNTGAKSVTVTVPAGALPVVVIAHTTASYENISPTDSLGGTYYYTNDGSTPNTYWIAFTRTARVATATSITFTQTPTLNTTGGAIFVFALTEGALAGSSAVRVSNSVWYSSGTVNPNMAWTRSRNYSDVVLQFYVSESGDTFTGPTASGYSFLPAVSASFNTPTTSFGFVYSAYVSPSDTDVITSSLWGGTSTGPVTLGSITFRTLNPHYTTGTLAGPGSTVAGTASLTVKVVHATSGALTGQGSTVAGTSTRFHAFSTTGALVGQSPVVAGSATRFHAFATSGVLTGQIGSVAGTSVHNVPHATSGVLTGQIGSVVGTANRFHAFATSGVLTGQIGSVAGTSRHNVPHATSGVLTGPGTVVVGTSTRFHAFATSGALTGQIGSVAGTADHKYLHATSGVLAGQGAAVAGSSTRFHAFATSGVLTGQLGSVAGTSARTHVFATSGALTGQGSAVAGTALRTHVFAASGALTGQIGAVAGTSTRFRTFTTTATLTGPGSAVAGTSARFRTYATSGALTGQIGAVAGTSVHSVPHATSGALTGQIGSVAGTSARTRVHDTSGALPGQTATLSATAERIVGAYARPSSGVLVAQGSTVSGSASRVHVFTTSGALTGQSSTVAGSASRVHIFTTSGTLSGQGAVVVSSANRTHVFSTSGALAGQAASVAGTARRFRTLSTSGVLAGQSSVLAGTSARFHAFSATGTLAGQGAALAGVSSRTHVFTAVAALIGQGSVVAGTARRELDLNAAGSLFGQGSAVSGSAVRVVLHSTAGSLTAQGSVIVGISANNTTHAVSGSLTGPGAEAVGAVLRAGAPGSNTAGARGFMVFF